MKRARLFLKCFLFVQLGGCLGRFLWQYVDYRRNPALYEINSAPWYTGILLLGALTAVAAALTLTAYLILGAAIRKREGGGTPADAGAEDKEADE